MTTGYINSNNMKLDIILMLLLALLFFGYGLCFGQVSVIHFNSEWNAQNDFDITTLSAPMFGIIFFSCYLCVVPITGLTDGCLNSQ